MNFQNKLFWARGILIAGITVALFGCAHLNVTRVDDKSTAEGIRYYLPKPFVVVTPRADGTVALDVIYLPDKDHEYAIEPSSTLSAYTFQISRDEKGLLTAVEYKADTSIVGQQLAASAGSGAAQTYTIASGQMAAQQTQVNTSQTALDAANLKYQSALAGLSSDLAAGVTNTALIADSNVVAQAYAGIPIAQAALDRAKASAQATSSSITAATPVSAAGPQMGTMFGQPAWNPPFAYDLPSHFGPVLFAIDDRMDVFTNITTNIVSLVTVTNTVTNNIASLEPVTNDVPDSLVPSVDELEQGVDTSAQRMFETTGTPMPTFGPDNQTFNQGTTNATFVFGQPIVALTAINVRQNGHDVPVNTITNANNLVLTLDISKLGLGNYYLHVNFVYQVPGYTSLLDRGRGQATFSIKP
jgi:hypothetical protein